MDIVIDDILYGMEFLLQERNVNCWCFDGVREGRTGHGWEAYEKPIPLIFGLKYGVLGEGEKAEPLVMTRNDEKVTPLAVVVCR